MKHDVNLGRAVFWDMKNRLPRRWGGWVWMAVGGVSVGVGVGVCGGGEGGGRGGGLNAYVQSCRACQLLAHGIASQQR